jgi:spermidine synthase
MAAVNLALVIIPTLLMGATLPLLVAHLVRRAGNVGSAVGLLYYVNTLGAGAACLASALLLFPFFGLQGAINVAVGMNGIIALGALAMHWRDRGNSLSPVPDRRPAAAPPPAIGLLPMLLIAAVGGFVSLSYEIFFFRTVSYASGSSATAFAATLSAFLVGLASGSRQAGRYCRMLSREEVVRRVLQSVTFANLVVLMFLPLLSHLAWLERGFIGVALLMVYLVARFWGLLLPCLAELGVAADGNSGMRTALLYLANILGCAMGSVLTGFVLMDYFGLVAIACVLGIAGFLCIGLFAAVIDIPRWQKIMRSAFSVALAVIAVVGALAFSDRVLENLQRKGPAHAKRFVDVVQTRSGIITVDAEGTVFGHGMYDGRFNVSLRHDSNGIVRPYALSLFHATPRHVLMIGLSSGSWAQVIASNPEVASLTVVEINPGYLQLVARAPVVASVLRNPKATMVTDDGRRWLRLNPGRRFDAIVSNTTWHFRANVTNLLSAEFLELIRDHLEPGGVFFYNTTSADRVQRTGCLAFAHGARFLNHMVVSSAPIGWDFVRWRRVLEAYRIDGKAVFEAGQAEDRAVLDRLMAMEGSLAPEATGNAERPIEPCADIVGRTAGKPIVTDDNMGSEWRYSLGLE